MNQIAGLNEESINAFCLEIQDYIERFQVLFNQFDQAMNDAKTVFSDEVSNVFFEKYAILQKSYDIVKKNLFGYIDDFQKAITTYKNLDELSSSKLNAATIEVLERGDL